MTGLPWRSQYPTEQESQASSEVDAGKATQQGVSISDPWKKGPLSKGSLNSHKEKKTTLKLPSLELVALELLCTMGVSHFLPSS